MKRFSLKKLRCKSFPLKYLPGGIVINTGFTDIIRQHCLDDLGEIMSTEAGEVIKHAIEERKTVKIAFPEPHPATVYLKRHYTAGHLKTLAGFFRLQKHKTAYDEFVNICEFHSKGLPTVIPVAAGIKKNGMSGTESFLLTIALENCMRLDHYLDDSLHTEKHNAKLITKLALLIKKMHESGFNHRDMYLCHILIDKKGGLFIVDLHRADKRNRVPERWIIKDLAALNYSAPTEHISGTDRLRFLRAYLGINKLTGQDKLFIRKILKKTTKMLKHNRPVRTLRQI